MFGLQPRVLELTSTRCTVSVVETRRGRGLVVTRALGPGGVAVAVPRALCLVEPDRGQEDHWAGRLAARLAEAGGGAAAGRWGAYRAAAGPSPRARRGFCIKVLCYQSGLD